MTESELAQAAQRLANAEEKFLATITGMTESMNAMIDVMKGNREHFTTHLHAFDKTEDLMRQQIDTLKNIAVGMEAIVKGCHENNLSLNENNERMKALLIKIESYFGNPAGLEFEN